MTSKMKNRLLEIVYGLAPLLVFLAIWQAIASDSERLKFLFGSPVLVLDKILVHTLSGELLRHSIVTGFEAFTGFLVGVSVGSIVGFLLLYFPKAASVSRFYIVALGSVPIFAFAPMMIVWFGIGIKMKIAMAFFSTVLVALSQSYAGGRNVDPEIAALFELSGASNSDAFWKLILPSSMDWVLSSLRLNIGLALLGAFIGEFIAAEEGLGYLMLKAGGVYDVPYVLAAACFIVILALGLNSTVSLIEKNRKFLIERLSTPRCVWRSNVDSSP